MSGPSPIRRRTVAEAQQRTSSRERLFTRFDGALQAPVTLVVADEGLGKSAVIRDYLARRTIAHVRFTARPEHAEPGELLRGLAAALSPLIPAMAHTCGPAARHLEQNDGTALAIGWAREHLRGVSATIVLDEVHHLTAEPRSVALLCALIETTQPQIRWIVAVRDASALPVPRWLASGICRLPIESDELRMQPDEIRAAFEREGIALDASGAEGLFRRTGGWPLGVCVALAAGRPDLALTRNEVYDELVASALRDAAVEEQDRLFELGAIGRFDLALTDALDLGPERATLLTRSELVHELDRATHAIDEPCRRRLAERLEHLPPERRATIVDRAAAALEHVGRWREAVALRVRAADPDRVADALDRRGFDALDRGEVIAVADALAAVPEDFLLRHPVALALKGALASIDASFDVAEAWFRMAIDSAADAERREIVIRYGMDLVRRRRDDVIELLEAETAHGNTRVNADADAALWALLGTAYAQAHRRDRARDASRRALALLPRVADDAVRARVLHQASYVALSQGDYASAKSLAERALARADAAFLYDLAARALSVLFNVAMLHDDDVPAARDALLRLEEAGRKAGNDSLRLYAILNAYAIEVDAGDIAALDRLNRQLGEMQVLLTPMVSEALLPAQALRAAWAGDFAHAYDLLAPGAEKLFDDERTAYRWAEVAVYAAAAGKISAARAAIARSRASLARVTTDEPLSVRSTAYLVLAASLIDDEGAGAASLAEARGGAAKTHPRVRALVETIAAFRRCRRTGARGLLALAEMLDVLRARELGGVARFIERLPVAAIEARARYEAAG